MNNSRILIVEDEAIVARDIEQQLLAMRYQPVGRTAYAEQAVTLVQQMQPDLVLMDINLSGEMDGIAAAITIRDQFRLPVIFITAYSGGETLNRATLAEPFGYITKPFNERDLQTAIEIALHKHRIETALRSSEAKFRALYDSTSDAVMLLDEKSFFDCNRATLQVFGCATVEEFCSYHPADLSPSLQLDGIDSFELATQHIATALEKGSHQFEWLHQRANSQECFLAEVLLNAFELDGRIVLQATVRDITERKKNECQLRIAAIAFEAQIGLLVTDVNKVILQVNQAFTDITGFTTDDALGKKSSILKSGRHDDDFYASMWQTINKTGVWKGEVCNRHKNGEYYLVDLAITAVKGQDGVVSNYVGSLSDSFQRQQILEQLCTTAGELEQANILIEQERAQLAERVTERTVQLLQANKVKDSFLATMSHEIRTPLTGLLGMMELLSLSQLDDKQNEMLKVASSSGKNLQRIVDDILDWSKIEADKLELVARSVSIKEMINGIFEMYSHLASGKGIQLQQRVDESLSVAHLFDSLRVSQILNNFTSNAIKFTQNGRIEISAELVAKQGGSEQVRFSVQDSGVGIAHEDQERLFQNYAQASVDTARMYGGTGLGLAICRKLAELMGGIISLESSLDVGSTFSFTVNLPVTSAVTQRCASSSSGKQAEIHLEINDRQYSLLVVDDHPINRLLLKNQLVELGDLRVEVADSGKVALAQWQSGQFDLIITDCHMPEIDGYELTSLIREKEQQLGAPRIPVIAWTANALAEESERCQAAGMDDILTKPTELSVLRAMLDRWLPR
ncbi:MAG: response regulator [Gallionella sp.]